MLITEQHIAYMPPSPTVSWTISPTYAGESLILAIFSQLLIKTICNQLIPVLMERASPSELLLVSATCPTGQIRRLRYI